MKGIWMLEWSNSQRCFHLGERDELVLKNLRAFIKHHETTDYVPLCIGTYEECDMMADKLEPILQSARCSEELKRSRTH